MIAKRESLIAKLRALTAAQIATGVVAITLFGVASAVGVSHAAPAGKPTKEQCAAAGFKNYGQCVANWAHHKGYGG